MLTKQFQKVYRGAVTGESYQVRICNGNTVTVTYPDSIANNYHAMATRTMVNIPALMKKDNFTYAFGTSSSGGVSFGTGTAAGTEDDYTITQKVMNSGTGLAVTMNVVQDGSTYTGTYTITNSGSAAVTIAEVGLFGTCPYASSSSYLYLIDRTLLEEPLTIPAGGVGKVVYTITIS